MQVTAQQGCVSLRELLPEAEILGADDIRVVRATQDSRRCQQGDLFVALRGSRQDGHAFVHEAARRGAAAVLLERPVAGCYLPACYVPDSRQAWARLCLALAGHPEQRLKLVGITGTNGKSTTALLAAAVLQAGGMHTGLLGTLGYYDGCQMEPAHWTTPPPHVLVPWLARMVSAGCTHAVMEVSSHALHQQRVAGLQFDIACLTNIRHDHLDYHFTPQRYRAAKRRLFEQLAPEGVAIINRDDPVAAELADSLDGPSITVSIDGPGEITATIVEQCASEQTFLLSQENETIPVRTRLIGEHNVSNCLLAAAVGRAYGLELPVVARGLEAVESVPGRLERIECGQPFGVFVDYAHTPDALAAVLDTLRRFTAGRLICVFGAGGERDQAKRPHMGRAVELRADLAILTTDNPRGEDPERIARQVLSGFRDPNGVIWIADRAGAIAHALAEASAGDCVLIAGKGHETWQEIGSRRIPFEDREVVRKFLWSQRTPCQQQAAA